MKKLLFALLGCIAFVACMNEAAETHQNGDFKVELLFVQDSCKMYRFKDGGRYVYWANCAGNVSTNYNNKNSSVRVKAVTTMNDQKSIENQ